MVNPPQDPTVDPPLAPVVIPPPNSVPHHIDVNVVIQPPAHQSNDAGLSVQCSDDIVLDAVILDLLGKGLVLDRTVAPAVHNDNVVRWEEILKKGLPTEKRDIILINYPPPNNCLVIDPPKLNPVVKTSLQDLTLKRDDRIRVRQEKITACLAAVSMILLNTIKDYKGEAVLVEHFSRIGRLLADLQYNESEIGRTLTLANLNTSVKKILITTTVDE